MAKEIMKSYTYRAKPSQQLKVIKKAKKEQTSESEIVRNLIINNL